MTEVEKQQMRLWTEVYVRVLSTAIRVHDGNKAEEAATTQADQAIINFNERFGS